METLKYRIYRRFFKSQKFLAKLNNNKKIKFFFFKSDGKFRAVTGTDDDNNSTADHIETIGAQRNR